MRTAVVDLKVILQDVRKFETEALVVECFEDVRPLKGLAGELDWLLCGALSSLLVRGKFRGALGEVALITPKGKVPVQKLFLVGRGSRSRVSAEVTHRYGRSVAGSLKNAGVSRAALEYATVPDVADDEQFGALRSGLEAGAAGRELDLMLLVHDITLYEKITRLVQA